MQLTSGDAVAQEGAALFREGRTLLDQYLRDEAPDIEPPEGCLRVRQERTAPDWENATDSRSGPQTREVSFGDIFSPFVWLHDEKGTLLLTARPSCVALWKEIYSAVAEQQISRDFAVSEHAWKTAEALSEIFARLSFVSMGYVPSFLKNPSLLWPSESVGRALYEAKETLRSALGVPKLREEADSLGNGPGMNPTEVAQALGIPQWFPEELYAAAPKEDELASIIALVKTGVVEVLNPFAFPPKLEKMSSAAANEAENDPAGWLLRAMTLPLLTTADRQALNNPIRVMRIPQGFHVLYHSGEYARRWLRARTFQNAARNMPVLEELRNHELLRLVALHTDIYESTVKRAEQSVEEAVFLTRTAAEIAFFYYLASLRLIRLPKYLSALSRQVFQNKSVRLIERGANVLAVSVPIEAYALWGEYRSNLANYPRHRIRVTFNYGLRVFIASVLDTGVILLIPEAKVPALSRVWQKEIRSVPTIPLGTRKAHLRPERAAAGGGGK